jgi:hypothetical protein
LGRLRGSNPGFEILAIFGRVRSGLGVFQWASARTVPLNPSGDARNTRNQSLVTHEECTKNGKSSRVVPLWSRSFLRSQGQFKSSTLSAHSVPASIMRFSLFNRMLPRDVSDVVCILALTREVGCETFPLSSLSVF